MAFQTARRFGSDVYQMWCRWPSFLLWNSLLVSVWVWPLGFYPDWKDNTLHCATHSTKSETRQLPPGTLRVQLSLLSTPFYFTCVSICLCFCTSSSHWLNMRSNKGICLSPGVRHFTSCFFFVWKKKAVEMHEVIVEWCENEDWFGQNRERLSWRNTEARFFQSSG